MDEPKSAFEALKQELENFHEAQATAWIGRVLESKEYRLSDREMSSAAGLRVLWLNLSGPTRTLLHTALTNCLKMYLSDGSLDEEKAIELLYLCRELRPPAVKTVLGNLLTALLSP